ncbi:hypothetical protein BDW02DRAFT_576618 [Decorospora gaudefroyi]|uniref:Mid2 domain-containing protein n=1 Tax=Decorospora gaudefroyi TaxID=184978 RepID=A0A6A5KS75_9PLEO|nr:hypothetical protein BDW02DRAFT_576618 [Decorospora gaudefroyi]
MAFQRYTPLLLVLLGDCATAAVVSAPTSLITPAPVVKRDVTTVGFVSTDELDGTTYWDTITVNEEDGVIATSSDLFLICPPDTENCEFFICSNDYIVSATGSFYCGGSSTCSSHVVATDIFDQSPLTNYWCDDNTRTGWTIYETTPEATPNTRASLPTTAKSPTVLVTPTATPTPSTSESPIPLLPTATPPPEKKSTPVGAIAGGVIGGVAALAAIAFGVFLLLRRKRRNAQSSQAPTMSQPPQQPPPVTSYYGHEQKPAGVAQQPQQVQQYGAPPQFYDPNAQSSYDGQPQYNQQASQGGYMMPEKTPAATTTMQANPYYAPEGGVSGPASPVPVYSPPPSMSPPPGNYNELPTQRM